MWLTALQPKALNPPPAGQELCAEQQGEQIWLRNTLAPQVLRPNALYPLPAEQELSDEQQGEQSWLRKKLHDGSSAFLIAFICNKATMPVRAPMTVGLTPMVAR